MMKGGAGRTTSACLATCGQSSSPLVVHICPFFGLPTEVADVPPRSPCLPHHPPLLDPVPPVSRGRNGSSRKVSDYQAPLVPVQLHAVDDDIVLLRRPCLHVL